MSGNRKNLGAVTAYADAVKGGFTGTREQFCEDQARFAENAAEVAANLEESKKVLTDVNTAGETQVKAVQDEGTAQIAAVSTAGDAAVEDVYAAAEAKKTEISDIGTVLVGEQALTVPQQARVKSNLDAADGIVETASGEIITLDDASEQHLRGLKLFGKSTQDGTPTPEAPVDIMSVGGDGEVRGYVTMPVPAVGFTLPGIPVTSGGNYTDADGQMWVCDEVDFGRGVYVQRVNKITYDGSETFNAAGTVSTYGYYFFQNGNPVGKVGKLLCSALRTTDTSVLGPSQGNNAGTVDAVSSANNSSAVPRFVVSHDTLGTASGNTSEECLRAVSQWLTALHNAGTPLTVMYQLAEPAETPLTEEELAAYTGAVSGNVIVYGKSTQNGTPTPEAPVEIVDSVQALAAQYVPIAAPDGLCGIQNILESTYTDEKGIKWASDYIDFRNAKIIHKCRKVYLDTLNWAASSAAASVFAAGFDPELVPSVDYKNIRPLCTHFNGSGYVPTAELADKSIMTYIGATNHVALKDSSFTTVDELLAYFKAQRDAGNPPYLVYVLRNTYETPLSETELAAYRALRTNHPNTTIYADDNAGLAVEYAADTKLYIDKKFTELQNAILSTGGNV